MNRTEFLDALREISISDTVVVDIESNGLKPYSGNTIIGVAVFIPRIKRSYYFPFRHGEGKIDVELDDPTKGFHELPWSARGKKDLYVRYWWNKTKIDFGNLPLTWETELQAVLLKRHVVFHNAQFDIAFLYTGGYGLPNTIEDTMTALHLINEDMNGIWLNAPFKWSDTDRKNGKCKPEQVGDWALDSFGKPLMKRQMGNKELKWFSAYIGLPGAMQGELGLHDEMRKLEAALAQTALDNYDDPMNAGLVYTTYANGKDRSYERIQTQLDRFAMKLKLDDKAQMWMLPAPSVAPYAMKDVELTWGLRQWCIPIIKDWDNEKLYRELNEQMLHVTSHMERYGIRLDVDEARRQIEDVQTKTAELEYKLTCWNKVHGTGDDLFSPGSPIQIVRALNTGLLKHMNRDMLPSWWDDETRASLGTYEEWEIVSSKAEVLADYSRHPFVKMILEWRKASKIGATYLKNWLNYYDGNFLLHPNFRITGTVSGRLSSSGDAGNFQNIPDRGFTIKRALCSPGPEWKVVNIDYGQLELRLAAWIAEVLLGLDNGELRMTRLFESGEDMHAYTRDMVGIRDIVFQKEVAVGEELYQQMVYKDEYDNIGQSETHTRTIYEKQPMTDREIMLHLGYDLNDKPEAQWPKIIAKHCRFIAKTMNFGLLYSGGKRMLAKLLHLPEDVADVLVKKWRALYPAFPRANAYYAAQALEWRPLPNNPAKKGQYVTQPISGRHRRFDKYREVAVFVDELGRKQVYNEKESEARKAFNNIVQGLGGYIANTSALMIVKQFGPDILRLFGIIHDSLDKFIHELFLHIIPTIVEIMTNWEVRPALTVDVEYSESNWQDMEPGLHYNHGVGWEASIEDDKGKVLWSDLFQLPNEAVKARKQKLVELEM